MIRLLRSFIAVALFPSVTLADGLLYRLPDDGHWVRFEIDDTATEPDGTELAVVGTLTMSSVGNAEVDGKQCRWIEITVEAKRAEKPFSHVYKLMIPEEHLAKGKEPLKHVVKAWLKDSNGNSALEITDLAEFRKRYPAHIRILLHGPFEKTEKLDAIRVSSKLGELDCEGIACSEKTKRGSMTIESDYCLAIGGDGLSRTGVGQLSRVPSIRVLTLTDSQLGDSSLQDVWRLRSLEELYVSGTAVGDGGAASIARSDTIRHVDFSYTRISNVGIRNLTSMKSLYSLELAATAVNDEAISDLLAMRNLVSISLYGSQITNVGIRRLFVASSLKGITLSRGQMPRSGDMSLLGGPHVNVRD